MPESTVKVLHVSTATSWRGGEQQLAYLLEELNQLGIEQHVVCVQNSRMAAHCANNNLPHTTQKKRSGIDISFARTIKNSCKKEGTTIIHTHDAHGHTFALLAALIFRNKVPVIVSRRVDFPIKSKFKYNHPCVRKIVCVSDAIKAIASPAIKDQRVLVTVHSGIDLSKFNHQPPFNKLRSEFGLSPTTKLIGNTSALAPHKDYFTFLDTAKLVLESQEHVAFLIIGTGNLLPEIQRYAQQLGIAEHVIFTGFRNNIPEILPELDVFLITSETEGLGTSILDAFACGIPVVATNAGGIPELVEHQKTGFLATVKNPKELCAGVLEVLSNKPLRETLTRNAQAKLNHFTKEATAQKTLAIYREVRAAIS